MILIIRSGLTLALFCVPIYLFVGASTGEFSQLAFLIPLIGAVPAVLCALIIFYPVELLLNVMKVPILKNVIIPLLGSSLVILAMSVYEFVEADGKKTFMATFTDVTADIPKMGVCIGAGFIWGTLWRVTDWLAKIIRARRNM